MYCPFCGIDIPDHASVCTHCGSFLNLPADLNEGDIKRIRKRYNEKFGITPVEISAAIKKELQSEMVPALFASRVIAFIFDWGIISVSSIFLMKQYRQVSELVPLLVPLEAILYFSFLTAFFGQTFGKFLVGIRVVSLSDKRKPSLTQSLLRSFTAIISGLFLMAGFIAPLFNSKSQAWHDQLSGTMVVYRR